MTDKPVTTGRSYEEFAAEMAALEKDHRAKLARIRFWEKCGIRLIILVAVLAIFAPVIKIVFVSCLKSVAPIASEKVHSL